MANVLPADRQARAWRAYRERFIVVGSLVAIVCAVVAFLALAPVLIMVRGQEASLFGTASSSTSAAVTRDRTAIARMQYTVGLLTPIIASTSTRPYDAIVSTLEMRPRGVHINRISFNPGDSGTIILQGSADTGDAINAYRLALRDDARFTNVSVPVASLVGSAQGAFTMTITGRF